MNPGRAPDAWTLPLQIHVYTDTVNEGIVTVGKAAESGTDQLHIGCDGQPRCKLELVIHFNTPALPSPKGRRRDCPQLIGHAVMKPADSKGVTTVIADAGRA